MAGSPGTPIPFDTEVYDYGDNYNPVSGIYTVPHNGSYLIHARVYSGSNSAAHFIRVDGDTMTYTFEYDSGQGVQTSSTSVVLHLVAGEEVTVDPNFSGTVSGSTSNMRSSFGCTMLYGD